MTVYVVTSGSYSEYSIEAIFSTKEKAEDYRDWHPGCNQCIEEYTLDPFNNGEDRVYEAVLVAKVNGDYIEEPAFSYRRNNAKYGPHNYYQHTISKTFPNAFGLRLVRYIDEKDWDETAVKARMTRVLYDLVGIVKYHRSMGATSYDIECALRAETENTKYEI